jgi:Cd(II)/Pb(II)-responsive transcriptional regulator
MKIGELAKAANTPVETIRYYEREQLLPEPARTDGNYRIYDDEHAQRLGFIRRCRSLDMTLDEIRSLLKFRDAPQDDCGEVNQLLDDHIGHVAARISELKTLEKQLKALRLQCCGPRVGERLRHPAGSWTRCHARVRRPRPSGSTRATCIGSLHGTTAARRTAEPAEAWTVTHVAPSFPASLTAPATELGIS